MNIVKFYAFIIVVIFIYSPQVKAEENFGVLFVHLKFIESFNTDTFAKVAVINEETKESYSFSRLIGYGSGIGKLSVPEGIYRLNNYVTYNNVRLNLNEKFLFIDYCESVIQEN